jgi:hypothetical protein
LLYAVIIAAPFEALSDVFWGFNYFALSVPLFVTAILAGVFIRNYLVTVTLATSLLCAASFGMVANDSWGVLTTILFSIYILFICVASVSNLSAKCVLWICDKDELSIASASEWGHLNQACSTQTVCVGKV